VKVFKQGNWGDTKVCPICKTAEEGEVVLVGIDGTEEENIVQAKQVHLKCLKLSFSEEHGFIYMKTRRDK